LCNSRIFNLDEYGIDSNGSSNTANQEETKLNFSFKDKKYTPRSILVDLEQSVLDNIRLGPLSKLYNSENILNTKQGSGGTFAGGRYCVDGSFTESVLNRIRKETESCNLLGFQIVNALGGGCGSGLR
jgi:hypothetical protein